MRQGLHGLGLKRKNDLPCSQSGDPLPHLAPRIDGAPPPPHPRRRQRPSSSGVDWLLEAKPETPETAMLNGIRCTDSRPPSREAAPTSRTAHSTRVPSYLPRRERPADRHLLRAHAHVAQAGRGLSLIHI